MKDKNICHMYTPIGTVVIEEDGEAVTALYIDKDSDDKDNTGNQANTTKAGNKTDREENGNPPTALLQETQRQLQEYFAGRRKDFDLPLNPAGTEFQKRVWNVLRQIPYGETRSYGEVAAQAGNPKASRAVGGANHKNPIMIIIPCHRVIGINGSLVGFGGGLEVKEYLLALERQKVTEKESGGAEGCLLHPLC